MTNVSFLDKNAKAILEPALEHAGKEAKDLILHYINYKYGMNINSIIQYQVEFSNYLRKNLGHSSEIIISHINQQIANFKSNPGETDGYDSKINQRQPFGKNRISNEVEFLICDNCFWCASILVKNFRSYCEQCDKRNLSPIPIFSNEEYLVEVNKKRGITLSFSHAK